MRLKEKFQHYLKNNSKLKIGSDIFFYLLLILLIIPGSRREIVTSLKKLTLLKPGISENTIIAKLNEDDYKLIIEDPDGKLYNLQDFRDEVLFINFWASWCPPCRAEMPDIERLYKELNTRVKFLMITSEENEAVLNYIDKFSYTFPVYFQRSQLPPSFKVSAIPHTFVIDRKGNILISKTGAAKWDSSEFKSFLESLI